MKVFENVSAVSCGNFYTMAILNDGTLYAWGDNNASQLGDDSNIDRFVPVRTKTGVKRVDCGHTNTMYIDNEGDLNVVGKLFW